MKYADEFKKEAVRKYPDGHGAVSISRGIGVNENTIHTAVGRKTLLANGEARQEKLVLRKRIDEFERGV